MKIYELSLNKNYKASITFGFGKEDIYNPNVLLYRLNAIVVKNVSTKKLLIFNKVNLSIEEEKWSIINGNKGYLVQGDIHFLCSHYIRKQLPEKVARKLINFIRDIKSFKE